MHLKKVLAIISVVLAMGLIGYGYYIYRAIFSSNTGFQEKEIAVYIPSHASYQEVCNLLKPYLKDLDKFELAAEKKSYTTNIKAGKFIITKGMSSHAIVRALRQNIPVKVSFNNQERLENFAGRIARQIEADSISLLKAFLDAKFLADNQLTENNVLCLFIPNSYELYWNTSAVGFRERMAREYRLFWNNQRLEKAKKINLTPMEVIVLASIVHKETVKADERPKVAGVYLNRLKKGIKLEADPTVIYAMKKNTGNFNAVIKRVLLADLLTVSDFNTYRQAGLPPGPITMPDISAIDAVLDAETHNYIYFCASIERFGYHEFASTPTQHELNRRKYIAWVNAQGITR